MNCVHNSSLSSCGYKPHRSTRIIAPQAPPEKFLGRECDQAWVVHHSRLQNLTPCQEEQDRFYDLLLAAVTALSSLSMNPAKGAPGNRNCPGPPCVRGWHFIGRRTGALRDTTVIQVPGTCVLQCWVSWVRNTLKCPEFIAEHISVHNSWSIIVTKLVTLLTCVHSVTFIQDCSTNFNVTFVCHA